MRWREDEDDEGIIAHTPDEPLNIEEELRPRLDEHWARAGIPTLSVAEGREGYRIYAIAKPAFHS
jgi:hypothetical protein